MLSLTNKHWQILHANDGSSILAMLAANRQIDDFDALRRLNFENGLHDPFLMPDMQKAVDLLRTAQKDQWRVMIVGDYDADGITGAALLYETFQALGIEQVICRLPHRIRDGYGFQPHIVQEAIRDHVNLIVTVDNGVSSYEAIQLAKEHGILVLICDHHTIPEVLPPADVILHPKLEGCEYPFKDLTGVGVAFKFAQAACPRLMSSDEAERFLKWSLDLVAIGTVADCATVMGENRVLIKYGLIVIEKTRRPGLQNLLKMCMGRTPVFDTTLIGFRIAPRINAAGRISHPDASLKLLLTKNALEANLLANELQTLNARRQQKMQQSVEQAKLQLYDQILREKILIAKNKEWHPGIVGLIAGKLMEEYYRPAIIFHERDDGVLVASARSTEHFNIIQALTQQKDLLLRFGGHSQAAGCSVAPDKYETFCEQMKALANQTLTDEHLHPLLKIDCELPPEQVTLELKRQIDLLEPYGNGNERPLFALKHLEVQRMNAVGNGGAHLQLWLKFNGKTLKGIAFQQSGLAEKLKTGDRVSVACHLQENAWNGETSLEIEVVDVQRE